MLTLILLLAAAVLIGYYVAKTKFGDKVDETTDKVASTSKSVASEYSGKTVSWWQSRFGKSTAKEALRSYTAGSGSDVFPDDFKTWLLSLSEEETRAFVSSLNDYEKGLGFELSKLVQGGYDNQPALKGVFVETIVVYSQAFRKAKEAQAKPTEEKVGDPVPSEEGKQPAEKATSRRKEGSEPVQAASA